MAESGSTIGVMLKSIHHKNPGQTRILREPTARDVVVACEEVSHYIIVIDDTHKFTCHDTMMDMGWVKSNCGGDNVRCYYRDNPIVISWKDINGFLGDRHLFENIAKCLNDNSVVIEMGTHHGADTACIADCFTKISKSATIYTFNDYDRNIENQFVPSPSIDRNMRIWKRIGFDKVIIPSRMKLPQLNLVYSNIDFLYINMPEWIGRMSTSHVHAWVNRMCDNGIIVGHGYEHVSEFLSTNFSSVWHSNKGMWKVHKHNYVGL